MFPQTTPLFTFLVLLYFGAGPLTGQVTWDDPALRAAFDSLVSAAEAFPDDSILQKSYLLHEAGKRADSAGDSPASIALTQRALALRQSDEALAGKGVLLSAMNLGIYHSKIDQHRKALDYFGMITSRAPNAKEGAAWFQIARSYGATGEFAAGEYAFARAAELPPFSESPYLQAVLQEQRGALHLDKNNASGGTAAIAPLTRALTFYVEDGDLEGEMLTRNYLGWANADAGNYPEAVRQLTEALRLAPIADAYDEDYASIYSNLGMTLRRQGDPESALLYLRKALDIQLSYNEGFSPAAPTYSSLSTAFRTSGRLDSALHYAQKALSAVIPEYTPTTTTELPAVDQISKNQPAAMTYLTELGLAHSAIGRPGDALRAFRRADELLDVMRLRQLLEDTRNYWRADARGLYDKAIAAARQAQDSEALFFFLEKARARLLLDELSANRAAALLPPEAAEQLKVSSRRVRFTPDDPGHITRFRRLQDSIFREFPHYAEQRIGAPPPSIAELPAILAGQQLVEYYVSETQTLALTYTQADGLAVTDLPGPEVWRPILQAYRQQLTSPNTAIDPSLPYRLYRALIAPLPLHAESNIVLIPDGDLYMLPFGALLTDTPTTDATLSAWPWFTKTAELNYAFSVQLLDRSRRQSHRGNGRVLAVAPVARIENTEKIAPRLELPATLRTVRQIAQLLPTDTLINAAATRQAFRQKADAYSVLHLGTHAYLEGGGSLLLRGGKDNRYTNNDLLEHQLRADLVVIGACETGLGKRLVGEGVASLGRAFARRGASGLIMSLWSIDDASTADLLQETYTALAAGRGPATALRTAGTRYREYNTNPRFSHPYYWAGLVHYGRDETLPMLKGKFPRQAYFIGGVLALLLVFALARFRSTRQ